MDFVESEPASTGAGGTSPTKPVEGSRWGFEKPLHRPLSFAGMEGLVVLHPPLLPWPTIFFLTNAGVGADKRQCFPYSCMSVFLA